MQKWKDRAITSLLACALPLLRHLHPSAVGTAPIGTWGIYGGPPLDGGKLLDRIVARDLTDIGNGCMGTVYRVRQVGAGAAFDAFCDEAALRHYWQHQAESALQRFDECNPQPLQ